MIKADAGAKLQVGDQAPQFIAADVQGSPVKLSDFKDRFLLLAFMRYAGCPWCNLSIHRLSLEYPLLRKSGCDVVAFMQSSPANVKKHILERHNPAPKFPIIPDPERRNYEKYGVKTSLGAVAKSIKDIPYWMKAVVNHGYKQTEVDGSLLLVPAFFLIAPGEQAIVRAEYGSSFYEHQTFTAVYEHLTFDRL